MPLIFVQKVPHFPLDISEVPNYNGDNERKFCTKLEGGDCVTNMKRVSVPVPDDIDQRILELRESSEEYAKYSYAKLVRLLLRRGLGMEAMETGSAPVSPAEKATFF